jgi:GNAT superfamily N-acetyltransferase
MGAAIRLATKTDLAAILQLHRETFEQIDPDGYKDKIPILEGAVDDGRAHVAYVEDSFVGMATLHVLGEYASVIQGIEAWYYWATDPELAGPLKAFMAAKANDLGFGTPIAEIYKNDRAQENRSVAPNDCLIADLVVHPRCRKSGIGTALVRTGIDQARQRRAPAAYAYCQPGHSDKIFGNLGFSPIVKVGPMLPDGSPYKLMVAVFE